jgi:hypothetical protein
MKGIFGGKLTKRENALLITVVLLSDDRPQLVLSLVYRWDQVGTLLPQAWGERILKGSNHQFCRRSLSLL